MSKKRTYWAKMNMDEARESIEIMEKLQTAEFLASWCARWVCVNQTGKPGHWTQWSHPASCVPLDFAGGLA